MLWYQISGKSHVREVGAEDQETSEKSEEDEQFVDEFGNIIDDEVAVTKKVMKVSNYFDESTF